MTISNMKFARSQAQLLRHAPLLLGVAVLSLQAGSAAYAAGTLQHVSGPEVSCIDRLVDSAGSCTPVDGLASRVTVQAVGGPVEVTSYYFQGEDAEHFYTQASLSGSCVGLKSIAEGETCTMSVLFKPLSLGSFTDAQLVLETDNGPVVVAIVVQANGVPEHNWYVGEWSACTGGTGEWQLGDWGPTTGCGLTEQTRTVSCSIDMGSGTRTRDVECRDFEGNVVGAHLCIGDAPLSSESCTPSDPNVCGALPLTTRSVSLNNDCSTGCVPDAANNRYCLLLPY